MRRILALYGVSGLCMILILAVCGLSGLPSLGARAAIMAAFALTGWFGLLNGADRASALSMARGLLRRMGLGRFASTG